MAVTAEDIRHWAEKGKKDPNCSHVLVVCDEYDWEDYAVYVQKTEDIFKKMSEYTFQNMQKIMEIYSMKMDIEEQLKEQRAWHPEDK